MGISKFLKEAFSDEEKVKKEEERKRKFDEDCRKGCGRCIQKCSNEDCRKGCGRCIQKCSNEDCRKGCGRCIQKCLTKIKFLELMGWIFHIASKFLKAYHVVSFLLSYFTAVCFSINLMTELALDLGSTEQDSGLERLYFTCTLFLLFSLALNASFVLSLFWDVMDVVMTKDGRKYTIVRLGLFVLEIIVGLIVFLGLSHSGLSLYVADVLLASYVTAFALTFLCSLYLAGCVYTKPILGKSCRICLFVIGMNVLVILNIAAPIVYWCAEAGLGAIIFSALCPLISIPILSLTLFRGRRESGFVLKFGVFLFMMLICFGLIILASMTNYECGPRCQIRLPVRKTATAKQTRATREGTPIPGYSMCGKTWSNLELSITDMAFLANLAYDIDSKGSNTTIDALVNENFLTRGIKWDVQAVNLKKPSFYHIRNNDLRVSIIGIRGTSDSRDWLENLKIWNEIAIFQLFFGIFSIRNLPETLVSTYVDWASILDHHESYVDKLEEYIREEIANRTEEERREFFLVGHSLGGGLAKIVGARLKIRSVAFSSPGEVYNQFKYGYTLEDLEKYTTSFGARDDIISWIDKPGGLVQGFDCDNCGFFDIHSIRNTYKNLKEKCP